MSDLKERMAKLSPEKRALLQTMLMKEKRSTAEPEIVPRRREEGPAPLSFGQNRLWFLDQMVPGNAFFNLPLCLRLEGRTDAEALENTLNAIIERHEVLRTTFLKTDEGPVQIVSDRHRIDLPTADLRGLPEEAAMGTVRREFEALAKQPFNLSSLPLIRVKLLRLGERDHVLLLVQHHVVSDGWSMGVFIRELRTFYEAFTTGKPADLPELPIQYPDFAQWQRTRFSDDALSSQIDYWKTHLAGAPHAISLPLDRPRPVQQSFRGASFDFRIDTGRTDALNRLSREAGATLFMTLLTAFSVLLSRYSGQTDLLVGTPVANRSPRETEDLLGFFLNTLVLRTDMSDDLCFTDCVKAVKETVLEAFAHRDVPFERLVEALQPERRLNRHPLFQVMFVLQNAPMGDLALPGLTIRPMDQERFTSQFDLSLAMIDLGDGLQGTFEYDADLFDRDTVARMAANFETLLSEILVDPHRPVGEYELVSPKEKAVILEIFNDTASPSPPIGVIHRLFEEQVRKTPDNTAVVFRDRRLTYGELNRAANRTAHFLREKCALQPQDRVGVLLERSESLIAVLLGIMKSGGVYVPIDPEYPEARIRYILEDSGCKALITGSSRIQRLREWGIGARIAAVDEMAAGPADDPGARTDPSHLAYVIYTSGSTGRPKGVMIEHGGFVNMALSQIRHLGITEEDRVLQFFSIAFDGAMFDIFAALFTGGALVCVAGEESKDPEILLETMKSRQVTVAALPPTFIKVMGFENLRCLRILISAGERAMSDAGRFADADHHYWNLYGPTEASVMVSDYPIPPGYPPDRVIPIGKPIRNTRMVILTPEGLGLQPIGAPGEICIAGRGLARGYLGRPDLTAERFLTLPLLGGERIYRSGDVGRWLPDGNIELLGRIDDQVKVRGFRIELEEIEKRLTDHPDVTDAVVVVGSIDGEGQVLTAYVTGSEQMTVAGLRRHLEGFLPGHMLPSRFIKMDRLPLTPNRKIDKKALPDPDTADMDLGIAYAAPSTAEEEAIASVWADLLGKEKVGALDNYFALGGDSIRTVQVVSRLAQKGWKLSVRDIFRYPTPKELGLRLVPVAHPSREWKKGSGEAPLTPVQRWFFEEVNRSPHHFNQAAVLRGRPRFEPDVLESALAVVWAHHDAFRMTYRRRGDEVVQQYGETVSPPILEIWDWRGVEEAADLMEAAATRCQESLDLSAGQLVKTALFRLKDEDRLLIVVHHLVVDVFSFRILFDDLDAAYGQAMAGESIILAPTTASFQMWADAVQAHCDTDRLSAERPFWRDLALLPSIEMGPSGKRERAQNRQGKMAVEQLTRKETELLLSAAPQGRIEILLLAGLAGALAPRTHLKEGLVMMAGHGRESDLVGVEVGRTVGWFSTMYPLPLTLLGEGKEPQQAAAVRRSLEAIPEKGFGYAVLRYLCHDPILSVQPWPQIVFNYLGRIDGESAYKWFDLSLDVPGPMRDPLQKRVNEVEIVAMTTDGRLTVTVLYDNARFGEDGIRALLADYCRAMRRIGRSLESEAIED